jgi:hypothetical protein
VIAAAGLVAATVLGVLADRARDPGTAKRPGDESQVNLTVAFRALRVVAALNAGDTHALSTLAINDQPHAVAARFVAAYGNRANQITSLFPSDFGGRWGVLTITVPCQGGATEIVFIPIWFDRTTWFSSTWSALLKPPDPGEIGGNPAGCPPP